MTSDTPLLLSPLYFRIFVKNIRLKHRIFHSHLYFLFFSLWSYFGNLCNPVFATVINAKRRNKGRRCSDIWHLSAPLFFYNRSLPTSHPQIFTSSLIIINIHLLMQKVQHRYQRYLLQSCFYHVWYHFLNAVLYLFFTQRIKIEEKN